jgi:hypothetical protein
MKTIFSKFINKFIIGLYIALANSTAFAGGILSPVPTSSSVFGYSPGWIAGGILVAAVIGGIIAYAHHDDDDDLADILVCQ